MSKIIKVVPNDDYTLLIEFDQGDKILLNMQKLIKTMPYVSLKNLDYFKEVSFEDKAICWSQAQGGKPSIMPMRLTVDNILFMLRD